VAQDGYLVLARKWRPQTFEDIVGQEHIARTLQNAIRSGRIPHALLFVGTRGIGKTTTARIFARALNCLAFDRPTPTPCGECQNCKTIGAGVNIDVVEIDGASNNGVEDVRNIRDNIRMVPSSSRYKIYIIDEVHQLSGAAFNALLKTLEEPPEHAVFVLATTETHKLPATIVSRCQRHDFRRVNRDDLGELLRRILDAEGIGYTDEALAAVARAADGSVRDGESILEQLISYADGAITFEDVFDVLGLVDWQVMHELCDALLAQDVARLLQLVEAITVEGKDLSQFVQDVLRYLRNLLVCKTADADGLIDLPAEELEAMRARAARFSLTQIIRLVEQFAELARDFDSHLAQRIALETLLIRIARVGEEVSLDVVLEKLAALGAGGITPLTGATAPAVAPSAAPVSSRSGVQPAPEQASEEAPRAERRASGRKKRKTSSSGSSEEGGDGESSGASAADDDDDDGGDGGEAARPGRVTFTADNLRDHWEAFAHAVSGHSLSLGVSLGHAAPVGLDGTTLVLRFAAHQERARQAVVHPEARAIILETLAEFSENVRDYRVDAAVAEAEAGDASRTEKRADTGIVAPTVDAETGQRLLADPAVAHVVNTFRGRIVAVKGPSAPEAG